MSIKIGKLKLENPVMVASGTFGEEYGELIDLNKLGAIVAKTITLHKRTGNPPPRIVETASGMLNSIGLENGGVEYFMQYKYPFFAKLKIPVIISIAGESAKEFSMLAKALCNAKRIDALELNLSCPNVNRRSSFVIRRSYETQMIAQDEKATAEVIKAVRKTTGKTLVAKLSPNVTDIGKIARAAEDAGADALTVANTFLGMAMDIETRRPLLGNVKGGLSGPAIKPLALRLVYETSKTVKIPVIGSGGIMDWRDAVEFILCGASAVQVGTATFVNPNAAVEIIDGIRTFMVGNKTRRVEELIGGLRV